MIRILYAVISEVMAEDFEDDLYFAPGEYEIMIFQVPTLIEVDGIMKEYPAHTCILYKPGQHVHYKAVEGNLVYDWIRFDCDEPLYTEYYLPFGVPIYCQDYNYYIQYWQCVANENYWQHHSSNFACEQLMHIIFHRLHDYAVGSSSYKYRDEFVKLREVIYQHPDWNWTLEKMAEIVNLSTRSVQKHYKEIFEVTCMNEVILSRIERSKFLLRDTDISINEVCEKCGYNNFEHFSRQFKKFEGITPSKYRRMVKNSEE